MSSLLGNAGIRDAVPPLTVEQYHRMGETSIIDESVELVQGVIIHKMIKSPIHTFTVKRLCDAIGPLLPSGYELRKEEPLTLAQSEPEPDIAIVETGSYDPWHCHPSTGPWVIEVASSSEAIDRAKASIYAGAAIPDYWLVLPEQGICERYTEPISSRYLEQVTLTFDLSVKLGSPLDFDFDLRVLS